MATLVASDGTAFELTEGETLVGRGERELGDPPKVNLGALTGGLTVSRQHARLRHDNEQWFVEAERQSVNNTVVDGLPLPRGMSMPIHDGTRLQLGEVQMTFRGPASHADVDADTLESMDGHDGLAAGGRLVSVVSPGLRDVAGWAGRLPARPVVFENVGVASLTRVNPFEGLMVDATTWSDDQHYHRDAARVHQLVGHGWGIVEGLEVTVDTDVRRWLVVRSGVAIDPVGRMLLLPQDTRLEIAAAAGQRCFVTLKYAEQTAHPQSAWDGAEHATRIVESVEVSVELELPAPPTVELARFVASDALRDAVDPSNPQTGEVDLRFRERQLVRPRPDIAIAQLTGLTGDEDQASERHRLGVRFLAREIGQTTAYRARWVGTVSADQPLPHCALLYMTGDRAFTLGSDGVDHIRAFLNGGGVLLADPCKAGRWQDFADSVEQLAIQLQAELQMVARWHPLLLSRHVLVAPTDPPLVEGGGIVISSADLGCAWQGGAESAPIDRESIRQALELGINAAVFGQQRRRPLDVLDFEA